MSLVKLMRQFSLLSPHWVAVSVQVQIETIRAKSKLSVSFSSGESTLDFENLVEDITATVNRFSGRKDLPFLQSVEENMIDVQETFQDIRNVLQSYDKSLDLVLKQSEQDFINAYE